MSESHPASPINPVDRVSDLFNAPITRRTALGAAVAVTVVALTGCEGINSAPSEKHDIPTEAPTNLETQSGQEALTKLNGDVSMSAMVAHTMLSDEAAGRTIHVKEQSSVNTLDVLDVRFQRGSDAIALAAVQIRKGKDSPNSTELEVLCTMGTIDPSQADVPTSLLKDFLVETQISWVIKDKSLIAAILMGRKNWAAFLDIMADPEACRKDLELNSITSSKDSNLTYTRTPLEDGMSIEVTDKTANPVDVTLYPTQAGFTAANTAAQSLAGTVIKEASGA